VYGGAPASSSKTWSPPATPDAGAGAGGTAGGGPVGGLTGLDLNNFLFSRAMMKTSLACGASGTLRVQARERERERERERK
jgi:hypothetical protein